MSNVDKAGLIMCHQRLFRSDEVPIHRRWILERRVCKIRKPTMLEGVGGSWNDGEVAAGGIKYCDSFTARREVDI